MFSFIVLISATIVTVFSDDLVDVEGTTGAVGLDKLNIVFQGLDECESFTNEKLLVEVDLQRESDDAYNFIVSGGLTINDAIDNNLKGNINVLKCDKERQEDTCTPYFFAKFENGCDTLFQPNKLWSPIIDKAENLKKSCPIDKGSYNVKDAIVNADRLKKIAVAPGIYMAKMEGFKDEQVLCLAYHFKLELKV